MRIWPTLSLGAPSMSRAITIAEKLHSEPCSGLQSASAGPRFEARPVPDPIPARRSSAAPLPVPCESVAGVVGASLAPGKASVAAARFFEGIASFVDPVVRKRKGTSTGWAMW